ncbi:MAG: type VI secretion system protein TssA [Desulfosarcina sp.]|nr:type VI secretion system protein TssA [Desulfosarcina sp.]MBC2741649.1 type VI secretion system protein TssA [Desulfosarcina sp.]MBC2764563.1 type VI secretion system protein TssA [Desulfosarcina sp.]
MTNFDVEALLTEISPDSPCGEDISYDVAFLELERIAQGKAETQVGDYIQEGEEPDWKQVYRQSLELLERSRDLRLILYLTASTLCLEGLSGFCDGLALLRGVVERYWDHLYPQLDPEDDNDPLERMNIISSLSPPPTAMSDQDPMKFIPRLMEIPLCAPEDARLPHPNLRQMLIASGEISTPETEASALPTMQLIDAAFEQAEIEALKTTDQGLRDCLEHLHVLDHVLIDHVGTTAAPNFSRLEHLLQQMQSKTGMYMERRGYGPDVSLLKQTQTKIKTFLDSKQSNSNESQADTENRATSSGGDPGQALSGRVTSNQDVLKALDMIINHYEQREPSSPVPLLIKRAKRLVGRSFVDIIRDLSPDAMSQVQMVSGEADLPED